MNAKDKYDFLVIGDLHYDYRGFTADGKCTNGYSERWVSGRFPKMFKENIAPLEPGTDFSLQLGDLWNGLGTNQELQEKGLRQAWETFRPLVRGPLYPVIGNHESYDYDTPQTPYAMAAYSNTILKYAAKETGRKKCDSSYAFMHGPDLFIMLNTNESGDPLGKVTKLLKEYPESRHTFICGHIPVLPTTDWDNYVMPFIHDFHNEFRHEIMKRNPIFLAADLHCLSLADYVTGEGRITQLIANSIEAPFKELQTSYIGYPCLIRGAAQKPESPGWIKKYYTPGITRFWFGGGSGIFKIRVLGARVEADLYVYGNPEPVKTFVLTAPGLHARPITTKFPRYFEPGLNKVSMKVPPSLAKRKGLQYNIELPDGWKVAGKLPKTGDFKIRLPNTPEPHRHEQSIHIQVKDSKGNILANEFRTFWHQGLFPAKHVKDADQFFRYTRPARKDDKAIYFGWTKDELLISSWIKDPDYAPLTQEKSEEWWTGSSAELFLDVLNGKFPRLSKDTCQLAVIPLGKKDMRIIQIDHKFARKDIGDQIRGGSHYDAKTKLLRLNMAIPWKLIANKSFKPKTGTIIGLDMAYRDKPMLGGEKKVHNDPSVWASIRLEK